ncbi:uncharacterized protein LOC118200967 [Stegodyphus dumicola]|uniref:uncharacterized protein LOC118200967 n=1 Tax=Stegodyphus dumicola TaxID=202533 RepID=UPI0015A96D12|nr:uncharacterized protein LOC118200967 [Stegodyphus dumicola]XP_035228855.1 uncharacterized protein LOC118200967 [Stegodyphus dumicola]
MNRCFACNIKTDYLKKTADFILRNISCKSYNNVSSADMAVTRDDYDDVFHKTSEEVPKNLQIRSEKSNSFDRETVIMSSSSSHTFDNSPNKSLTRNEYDNLFCEDDFHRKSEEVPESLQIKRKRSNSFDRETVIVSSTSSRKSDNSPNKTNSGKLNSVEVEQSCSKTWQTLDTPNPAFSSKKQKKLSSSVEKAIPLSPCHHILISGNSRHSLEIQHNSASQT